MRKSIIPPDQRNALRESLVAAGRGVLSVLVGALLMLGYGTLQFNGLKHAEAMDQAQIGRNLARGEGFSTYFIRPLSVWILAQRRGAEGEMELPQPDISHPPLYPALLGSTFHVVGKDGLKPPEVKTPEVEGAVAKKAAPRAGWPWLARIVGWRHWSVFFFAVAVVWFLWTVMQASRMMMMPSHVPRHATGAVICALLGGLFWTKTVAFEVGPAGAFTVFGPDQWIVYGMGIPLTLLNCALLYAIARRLFDRRVAWTAAWLFGLAETTFQFALSGLSVMLTMAWVNAAWLALVIALGWHEAGVRPRGSVAMALAAAAAIAGAFLTRYAAGWLLLPLCVVVWRMWGLVRGAIMAACMGGVFLVVSGPWLVRNYLLSGKCLGLAGYATNEHTAITPGGTLQRLLDPTPALVSMKVVWAKAIANASTLWAEPWTASYSVVLCLFVAGLFYKFRRPVVNRFKWLATASWVLLFMVWCFVGFEPRPEKTVAQADNLLVLLVPLVAVFSAAVFYVYLDGLRVVFKSVRAVIVAALVLAVALPLLLRLMGPAATRMAYPPYHPPLVSQVASYVEPNEIIVGDQPWAVAWYGNRPCLWIPYFTQEFFTFNDMRQHVAMFMLTPTTLNIRLLTEVLSGEWGPWADILGFLKFPDEFPLLHGRLFVGADKHPLDWRLKSPIELNSLTGGVHMLILSDRKRWR